MLDRLISWLVLEQSRQTLQTAATQHRGTAHIGPTAVPLRYWSEVDPSKKEDDRLCSSLMNWLLSEVLRETLKTVATHHPGTAHIGPTAVPLRYWSEANLAKKATL